MVDVPRPPIARLPLVDEKGFARRDFVQFIELLWLRTGGASDAVQQQTALSPANMGVLVPEAYGCVGDGETDDTSAFTRFLADLVATGKPGILQGHYLVPNIDVLELTSHVSLYGLGGNAKINGGDGATLFRLVSAGLTFHNIETINIALSDSFNQTTGDIALIDIWKWKWTNTTQFSFRLRINYVDFPYKVDRLRLVDIQGNGGLGGVAVIAPIVQCEVDLYSVRNIEVPEDEDYFNPDNGNMIGSGFSDGLNLGADDVGAQDLTEYCTIGTVTVSGINDLRTPKPGKASASVDGVRIVLSNVTCDTIHVRDVTSQFKADTTAFYSKAQDSRFGRIVGINAGHHEAAIVFKGARRFSGTRSPGWNVTVDTIELRNTEGYVGRNGVYLGPDDISIGHLYLEGMGGEVEDPNDPGQRLSGQGPLVYCQNTAQGRLYIGHVTALNCVMGSTQTLRPFLLEGYDEIYIGPCVIDGLSNAGRFSTQSATEEQQIHVFAYVDQFQDRDIIDIGPVVLKNTSGNGRDVRVFSSTGQTAINTVRLRHFVSDSTATDGIVLGGSQPVGLLEVVGGDWSQVGDVTSFSTNPTKKRYIGPPLGLQDTPGTANRTTAQSVATATTAKVQFTNSDAQGWSDTNYELTVDDDITYTFDATITVRPLTGSDFRAVFALKRDRGGSITTLDQTEQIVFQNATPAQAQETMRVQRTIKMQDADKVYCEFSHTSGSSVQISQTGGGTNNKIDWWKNASQGG